MNPREARRRDRFQQFSTVAVQEALHQSGILETSFAPERVGVILSTAIGGLQTLYENFVVLDHQGPRRVSPFVIPMLMANGAAGLVAIDHGFKGPCFSVVSACASGADGIGTAWSLLLLLQQSHAIS
jgi:3-oxoacyl-(acyl-carrier-protein) synthase